MLVQHGEKDRGDDPGLTPLGARQARACAPLLVARDVVALYSSPARRCLETVAPIVDAIGLAAVIADDLIERMTWVPSSGMSLDEFLAEWERASADRDYVPSIGASSRAAGARMAAVMARLAREHATGTVVCVTHGGATVDLLRDVIGDRALERAAPGLIADGVPGGAVTTIGVTDSGLRVLEVARTGHLAPEPRMS